MAEKTEPRENDVWRRWQVAVALKFACRLSPSWAALHADIEQGRLSLSQTQAGVVQIWWEFFGRVGEVASDPADGLEALRYWQIWPRLYWWLMPEVPTPETECLGMPYPAPVKVPRRQAVDRSRIGRGPRPAPALLVRLDAIEDLHCKAEGIIRVAVEGFAGDSAIIAAAGELCRDTVVQEPKVGECGHWPDCLQFASGEDTAKTDAAAELTGRLEARLKGLIAERVADAKGDDAPAPREAVSWQKVRDRLLGKVEGGELYTSLAKLATEIGCGKGAIRKAIKDAPRLKAWQKNARNAAESPRLRAQSLNPVVVDNARSKADDPAEAAARDEQLDREIELERLTEEQKQDQHVQDHAKGGNRILCRKP